MKRKHSTQNGRFQRRRSAWILSAAAVVALGIAGLAGTAAAEPEPSKRQSTSGQPVDTSGFVDGATYIVTLAEDPVTMYDGGVSGIAATAPEPGGQFEAGSEEVKEYQKHLLQHHKKTAAKVNADASDHYTLTINGFAAELSVTQAKKLAVQKNVVAVEKSQLHKVRQSSTDFLGMGSDRDGSGGVWEAVGGTEEAGSGVVVGVIDTGIAPENPSFAGEELETDPSASTPYLDGEDIIYQKADGGTFTGACQSGAQFMPDDCNTKLISAKYFVEGFGPANIGTPETDGEYGSPRDGNGHGSHVAGVAAGNFGVEAAESETETSSISGVAPAAKIAAYKACWTGNDVGTTKDNGCATADLLAAIEAATADGVDVINYSIGGVPAEDTVSAIERAFLGAVNAGIFVAASSPGPESSANWAPWVTSVGTSTYQVPQSTLVLDDVTELTGASVTVPDEGLEKAPLILGGDAARDVDADARACAPGSLDPEQVKGKIVVCSHDGAADPVAKAAEVAGAGGVGMVLLNTTATGDNVQARGYGIPTVHLPADDRKALRSYAQQEDATASMIGEAADPMQLPAPQLPPAAGPENDDVEEESTEGATEDAAEGGTGETAGQGAEGSPDDIAGQSPEKAGEGGKTPDPADEDSNEADAEQGSASAPATIIGPDVVAPGTRILAAGANAEDEDPVHTRMSGASMAAPHVAGLAAVYLGEHPNAAPAEIKSALMTTAYNTVDSDGDAVTDALAQGAGHVDPGRYLDPGMHFPSSDNQWRSFMEGIGVGTGPEAASADRSELNLPSITIGHMTGSETVKRTVVSTGKGTYKPSVKMPGFDVSVSPSSLKFNEAGQQKTFEVTFKRTKATDEGTSTGYLSWTSKGGDGVRIPLTVAADDLTAPDAVSGKGTTGNLKMGITPAGAGETSLSTMGLVKGHVFESEEARLVDGFLGEPAGGGKVQSFGHSGSALSGQTIGYETEIPRGTRQARFSLDAVDDSADLDLVVVELDADGVPVQVWQSASGAADETVVIDDPASSAYLVQVNVHSPPPANSMAEFDLTSFAIPSSADDGQLAVSPENVTAKQGQEQRVKLSWDDLDPDSVYRGLVEYSGSTATTLVKVDTGRP